MALMYGAHSGVSHCSWWLNRFLLRNRRKATLQRISRITGSNTEVEGPRRHKRFGFLLVGLAGLGLAAWLLLSALDSNLSIFSPTEVGGEQSIKDHVYRLAARRAAVCNGDRS